MKISKSDIIGYSLFLLVILIDWNFLTPYVNAKYLESDIDNFENNTIQLLLLKTTMIWLFLNTIYFLTDFKEHVKFFFSFRNSLWIFICSFIMLLFFNGSCDNFLFYLNTSYPSKHISETYVVTSFKPNKVFFLKNNETIIYREGIKKIDIQRKELGLTSVHTLKNSDSITVRHSIGF
ncbi:MAG: hypothetical protein JKY44_02600 [Flavobacteriaceae bacterium]|nr:hypothetical protein [Flavobacteriaceae bacterium]